MKPHQTIGIPFGFAAAVAAALLIAIPASLLGWVPASFGWGRLDRRSSGNDEQDGSRSCLLRPGGAGGDLGVVPDALVLAAEPPEAETQAAHLRDLDAA